MQISFLRESEYSDHTTKVNAKISISYS